MQRILGWGVVLLAISSISSMSITSAATPEDALTKQQQILQQKEQEQASKRAKHCSIVLINPWPKHSSKAAA